VGSFFHKISIAENPNDSVAIKSGTLINTCNLKITVRWFDGGYCIDGCAAYFPAKSKDKMKSRTGKIEYASCFFPDVANGDWRNSGK
jgi:hypothetical protein